jgi:phage I-like protein
MTIEIKPKTIKNYVLYVSEQELQFIENGLVKYVDGHPDHVAYWLLKNVQAALVSGPK